MNHGFDKSAKKILDGLADVYKIAFEKNPKFTEAQKKYTEIKREIERSGVLKCEFLFKNILLDHLTAAIEKTEALADKESEMFVSGLDERMSESKEAFLKLQDALNGVFDWSSEAALERAKEILYKIRIWNNVKIVSCVTSVTIAGRKEVLKPIEEAEQLAEIWANATFGVGRNNPRVKQEQLRELEFQDDQLKVWMEIHKKRKTK